VTSLQRFWISVVAACAAAPVAGQAPTREAAFASLAELPDWTGWWGPERMIGDELRSQPAPIKPGLVGPSAAPPQRSCRPDTFTGSMGGRLEAVEFLFTPGRVTLTNEAGLVRRIYTDDRTSPADAEPTNTGLSIGHWEGQALVVETTHINPSLRYPLPGPRWPAIGANARVTERIVLKDSSTLEFEVVTYAPDILTEPDRRTRLYTRLPKTLPTEVTFCTEFDRSIDPSSGQQRFDLTLPADLPPPPPR
jgi:hypothetical protein